MHKPYLKDILDIPSMVPKCPTSATKQTPNNARKFYEFIYFHILLATLFEVNCSSGDAKTHSNGETNKQQQETICLRNE